MRKEVSIWSCIIPIATAIIAVSAVEFIRSNAGSEASKQAISINERIQEGSAKVAELEKELALTQKDHDAVKKDLKETEDALTDIYDELRKLEGMIDQYDDEEVMMTPTPTVVITQPRITTETFVGTWQDIWSKRAHMEVTMVEGRLNFNVQWANSASDGVIWRLISDDGFDPEYGSIGYYGSRYEWNEQHPMENPEQRSSEEHGLFKWENGYLHWYDNSDHSNSSCMFEKIQ